MPELSQNFQRKKGYALTFIHSDQFNKKKNCVINDSIFLKSKSGKVSNIHTWKVSM